MNYILNGYEPVAEPDTLMWARWFEENHDAKRVAETVLENGNRVSTVFLGIDHQFGDGPPLLFETMVFPSDSSADEDCERYTTWADAEKGHAAMVEKWRRR